MSGGWKWINIPYEEQLKIKEQQVKEALNIVEQKQANLPFLLIERSPTVD
jgi:tRNA/tmRNA/rRNA uracil-C5-methylase (TrmA/RlmC/RlmD family)